MEIINNEGFISQIIDKISTHYNFPMVEKIILYKDDSHGITQYHVELVLKESFEFADGKNKAKMYSDFGLSEIYLNQTVSHLYEKLAHARLKDYYLYRDTALTKFSEGEFIKNYNNICNKFFQKDDHDLTKDEKSIAFRYANCVKYNNPKEIVEDIKNFIKINGHFPYKNERLYNVLEYAKSTSFISDADLKEIYDYVSSYSFDKLCKFIEKEKRWPYQSEKEYSRCWSEVCFNYRKGLYSDEQVIKLDILYSKYNNDKDSLGERFVNSFISSLGYRIEKQKTFDDLVYKQKLRFDTCVQIDDNLLLIEYDGPQHFKAIDYFGGQKSLEETQIRDGIKNEYCQKNNIPLLRISYKQINDMEVLIKDFIEKNIGEKVSIKH